jgi:hypothetical protein
LLAPCVVAAVAYVTPCHADTPAENKAAARSLAVQGVQLAQQDKCEEAIPLLERAEKLYHAPTILTSLGECQLRLGHLVSGTETLNQVVRETLAPDAPAAFHEAQRKAQKLREEYLPKIAELTLQLAPAGVTPRILIDGSPVSSAFLGTPRPTDPGTRRIEISAEGYETLEVEVTLTEGGREILDLTLEPLTSGGASSGVAEGTGASSTQKTLGYVGIGVGAALLAAGGVTGMMAVGKENSLKQNCPGGACPASEQDNLDQARSLAGVATIATIGGAAFGITGLVLLLTSGGEEQPEKATSAAAPGWSPWVGWNTVGVNGSF